MIPPILLYTCFLSKCSYLPTMPEDLLFDQKNWKIGENDTLWSKYKEILLHPSPALPIWMADIGILLEKCPEIAWPGDGWKGGTDGWREGWLSSKIPLCFCWELYQSPFSCSNSKSI